MTILKRLPKGLLGLLTLLALSACDLDFPPGATQENLRVSVTGSGEGRVISTPEGVDCGSDCDENFTRLQEVTLEARPEAGSSFSGWQGDCEGQSCTLTMDSAKSVSATFRTETSPEPGPNPEPTQPEPTAPEPTNPEPANPEPTEPEPTQPEPTEPEPTTPEPTTPEPTDPEPTQPDPAEPTSPDPAEPDPTPPQPGPGETLELSVSSSEDDAEEFLSDVGSFPAGRVFTNSSDLELAYDAVQTGTSQLVGLRFTGLELPEGASLSGAQLSFTPKEDGSGPVTLTIRAQAASDAPAFAESDADLSERPLTEASVSWTPGAWTKGGASEATTTPDLSPLFEELAATGWTSGSVVFIISGEEGAQAQRNALAYDSGARTAPKLTVNYSGGTPTPDPTNPEPTNPEPSDPSDPEPSDPEPTNPDPTDPEPSNPEPTQPEPTNPEPSDPEPTDPDPTEPEPADPAQPEPTDPEPSDPDPEPSNPEPTNPEPTNPEPTNPEPTDPEPTQPDPADPEPSDPEPSNPEPTDPEPTDPEPSDPDPTEPSPGPLPIPPGP